MELLDAVVGLGTLTIAILGVWIALAQFRSANRDAHASRMADMSWQVYQSYADPRIRSARGAAEYISHTNPVPTTGEEYGSNYGDKKINRQKLDEETLDTNMRRLLRFYNQVGILIEKKLVDDDLVFALIGPGLKSSWAAIQSALDWYQNYYEGSSGHEKASIPRPIHTYVTKLYIKYNDWEKKFINPS